MGKKVFISYSSEDRASVDKVRQTLTDRGVKSNRDTDLIKSGRQFVEELAPAIEKCDAVLLIVSATSIASRWVMWELAYAFAWDKKIFPFAILGGTELTLKRGLKTLLGNVQISTSLPEVLRELEGYLGKAGRRAEGGKMNSYLGGFAAALGDDLVLVRDKKLFRCVKDGREELIVEAPLGCENISALSETEILCVGEGYAARFDIQTRTTRELLKGIVRQPQIRENDSGEVTLFYINGDGRVMCADIDAPCLMPECKQADGTATDCFCVFGDSILFRDVKDGYVKRFDFRKIGAKPERQRDADGSDIKCSAFCVGDMGEIYYLNDGNVYAASGGKKPLTSERATRFNIFAGRLFFVASADERLFEGGISAPIVDEETESFMLFGNCVAYKRVGGGVRIKWIYQE